MELSDGKFLEIKEWKSRDDLKAKDIATVRSLRNASLQKGANAIEITGLSVPDAVPSHSKSKLKLRFKNKTSTPKTIINLLKEPHSKNFRVLTPLHHETIVNGQKKLVSAAVIPVKDGMYLDLDLEFESHEVGSFKYSLKFKIDNFVVPFNCHIRVVSIERASGSKKTIIPPER